MQFVSPRQLARAAGVSESSVKRWCDQGLIPTVKTAGGHRRLTLEAATEFLRQSKSNVNPELLGLPTRSGVGERTFRNIADDFYRALIAGNEEACRQVVFDLHLAGERSSRIFDSVIAPAFHCVGLGWECDEVQVYQERRGCGICLKALAELKSVIPAAKQTAPHAIGGTPECDPYMLPTAMVEIVLTQSGWRSQSLGSRLPIETLLVAIRDLKPSLFWLSVSHLDDAERFLEGYRRLYQEISANVAVVVGGRALTESVRRDMEYAAYCDNLQHLEAFAKTLNRSLTGGDKRPAGTRSSSGKSRKPKSERRKERST